MRRCAVISSDGKYRYSLIRHWGPESDWINIGKLRPRNPRVVWVMLNPSTADSEIDDPTIRKCIGFTKRWGFESIVVINLFALRATYPEELKRSLHPFGEENLRHWKWHLQEVSKYNDLVIAAWGNHGNINGMGDKFKADICKRIPTECLGITKNKQPKHPLMLSYKTERVPFGR